MWARYLGTTVETTNSVGAKMILIPPGEFLMGSTEVTVAEFRVFVTYAGHVTDAERFGTGNSADQTAASDKTDAKKQPTWPCPGLRCGPTSLCAVISTKRVMPGVENTR